MKIMDLMEYLHHNIYFDYSDAKSNKRDYGLIDGVRSFPRQSAVKKLIKDYGGLHPRVKLKESKSDFEEEE
jgi:hypothetical protein